MPLVGTLRKTLAAHKLATGRDGDDVVFGRTAAGPFVPSTVRRRALAAWNAAGLRPLTPHEARHSCVSYLLDANLSIKKVSAYVGHTDVRTTLNCYGHLLPGNEPEAAAQLDAYLAAAEASGRRP